MRPLIPLVIVLVATPAIAILGSRRAWDGRDVAGSVALRETTAAPQGTAVRSTDEQEQEGAAVLADVSDREALLETEDGGTSRDARTEEDGAPHPPKRIGPTLTEAEIFALEQSFEALHLDSTREQLFEAYDVAMARIPSEPVEALHATLLDRGQYEVIDAHVTRNDAGHRYIHVPREVQQQNKPVLSLTHYLADGKVHRTWIEPGDMPSFEQDIRYANWLMDRIRGD